MRIKDVIAVPTSASYYVEDVTALQETAVPLEQRYVTPSKTKGFRYLREPGEAVSVGVVLQSGVVAWGDCVGVCYAGKAGRDPLFRSVDGMRWVLETVKQKLVDRDVDFFRDLVGYEGQCPEKLPAAVSFGVSQALLQATSLVSGLTPTEVICREWDLPNPIDTVPLHAVAGRDSYEPISRMMARRVDSLPHSLVDDIPSQMGVAGEKLVEYVASISRRLQQAEKKYHPVIHIDVHGAIAKVLGNEVGKIAGFLLELEAAAQPYSLRVESAVMEDSLDGQIRRFQDLRKELQSRGSKVQLVADEWANDLQQISAFADARAVHMVHIKMPDLGGIQNSIEAVLYCKEKGMLPFLGGSVNETEISARLSAHVALATQPAMIMAKPGMGVDEGVVLVGNEMARTLAALLSR